MECKKCINCKYVSQIGKSLMFKCARYPDWLYIQDPYFHWCGEWQEQEKQEEQ